MARILMVEDVLDIGAYEASLLQADGHEVALCRGAPGPFAHCPLMRDGSCWLVDAADLVVFSCALHAPVGQQRFRGHELLRAYRAHAAYGAKPFVVVSLSPPGDLPGTGRVEWVHKFSPPRALVAAVEAAIEEAVGEQPAVPLDARGGDRS